MEECVYRPEIHPGNSKVLVLFPGPFYTSVSVLLGFIKLH